MNILYVKPEEVGEKQIQVISPEDIRHLSKVLRVKAGDMLPVSDGSEWEYVGRIEEISEYGIVLSIVDKQKHGRELSYHVELFQGVPKSPKLELIVRKSVELGASAITPVYMDRCVNKPSGREDKKRGRLQKIADEAVKQCLSPRNPIVNEYTAFNDALNVLPDFDLVIFPYENEENKTLKDLLTNDFLRPKDRHILDKSNDSETSSESEYFIKSNDEAKILKADIPKIAVIIGPEGGFSTKEVEKLRSLGIRPVSLGKSILRTETAGPATLAMLMYEFEL